MKYLSWRGKCTRHSTVTIPPLSSKESGVALIDANEGIGIPSEGWNPNIKHIEKQNKQPLDARARESGEICPTSIARKR
jgi:hypothetical protein